VHRHPARYSHANRSEFLLAGPDAGQSFDALGSDPEIGRGSNENLFEVADVAANIATIRSEFDDRISDELSRAVISYVAAATRLE
jgi:hypothetical protein